MDLDFLNSNRRILISLLSAAIRGEAFHPANISGTDWQVVFDEAFRHQVMPLVYPLLAEVGNSIGIPGELLEKWRINTLYEGMEQERNYVRLGSVLERFSNAGIPVIVLKGLVLRELYPHPSLRTMCDADLLVRAGDMDKAGRILKEAGYKKCFQNDKHTVYSHKTLPDIELHRSLVTEEHFDYVKEFENGIWNRASSINIGGVEVLSLNRQDEVLYLLLHMASHIISSGFGLRQLCDIVLVLEANKGTINLDEILKTAAIMHIEKFTKTILSLCDIIFDINFPEIKHISELQDFTLIRSFAEVIFEGGVFGNNSDEYFAVNRMIFYSGGADINNKQGKFKYLMDFLFPGINKLDIRFKYAKVYHFLLPVAWVHRLFYSIIRKDLNFGEKFAVLTTLTHSDIYSSRSAILRKLGLLD